MANNIDQIVQQIEKPGREIIEKQAEVFSKQIKKYAYNYLEIIKRNQKQLQNIKNNLNNEKESILKIQTGDTNQSYQYRALIQERKVLTKKDCLKQMIEASLKFQNQLNQLLDQKVQLVYVYQDENNNPTLFTINEQELIQGLTYEQNKGKIVGRFRENAIFNQYLKNLTQYDLYEKFNLDYFNFTYKQVIWRFNYGKKKKSDLIMWLNPMFGNSKTKWLKAAVNKQGDIKQAYASVILDRKINSKKLFNDSKLDNNIHSFMEEVAKVDNQSGLLKGDVTVGKIEYAIKGISAQTLGMQQIIDLAKKIANIEKYTKQNLEEQKKAFHEKAQTRNHIQSMGAATLNKWQKDLGKSIEKINSVNMSVLIKFQPAELRKQDIF